MDSINLSPANQAYVQQNQQQVATNPKIQVQSEQKKNGKKLLIAGAVAVATIAVASIMLHKTDKISKVIKKFEDIDFDKGIAKDKDGKLFTGVIDDVVGSKEKGSLKNVKLEYKKGVLQKSTINGDVNCEKIYKKVNGEQIIEKIEKNSKRKINLTKKNEFVKKAIADNSILDIKLKDGKLDPSQCGDMLVNTHSRYTGFDEYPFCDDELTKKCMRSDVRTYEKLPDGRIIYNPDRKVLNTEESTIHSIYLASKDNKLSDAQKIVIAAEIQGLTDSPNSPIGKICDEMTKEEILNLIAKWGKDIDPNDKKTLLALHALENAPKGTVANYIKDLF